MDYKTFIVVLLLLLMFLSLFSPKEGQELWEGLIETIQKQASTPADDVIYWGIDDGPSE